MQATLHYIVIKQKNKQNMQQQRSMHCGRSRQPKLAALQLLNNTVCINKQCNSTLNFLFGPTWASYLTQTGTIRDIAAHTLALRKP
jgi:hypothetical protein